MTAAANVLTLDRVKPGDSLPALEVDVTATTIILGALASRDWRPMHHDKDFAIHRNGTRDIFMNTPNQAAWFERYLTDWTGPQAHRARSTPDNACPLGTDVGGSPSLARRWWHPGASFDFVLLFSAVWNIDFRR